MAAEFQPPPQHPQQQQGQQLLHTQGRSETQGAEKKKPTKKMCCACPDTKKERDECIVLNGEDACQLLIEAHKRCLRMEGFNV